jgi:hypothetical protein
MKKRLIISILILISANLNISAQQQLQLNKWITEWTLLGPIHLKHDTNESKFLPGFEKDYLSHYGSERSYIAKAGKKVKLGKSKLIWQQYKGQNNIISLDSSVSKEAFVMAYAYTEIVVDKAGTYILALGSNDGGKMWINGKIVWERAVARGCKPDDDLIPVLLNKGINKIMLKIEEKGNRWEFCVRFRPFSIATLTSEKSFFEVVSLADGTAELRCSHAPNVVRDIFDSVTLEIVSATKDSTVIWQGKWSGTKRMPLPINLKEYKPYVIKINALEKGSKGWKTDISFFAGNKISYPLFSNGKTDYRIVIGSAVSESEKWAAKELQKYLSQISGADFSIVDDKTNISDKEIVIGYNKHSQELLGLNYKKQDTTDESFLYKNIGANIVLAGGSQRGTMYAVFTFLEKEFGVRWYTPKVTIVPKRNSYTFSYLWHIEEPTLHVRNDFYYEAFDPKWAAHNKINGAMGYRKQHGGIEGYWEVHTFYQLMPPSEYYKQHPEYYSLIDEKRVHEHAQLCITNPDVLNIITERLKEKIKENPTNLIYSVSQNDWGNPCQCDNCQAIVQKEKSEAGLMVWFVNQVAERIQKDYPDKFVGTLAYQYTRKPPKSISPKDNVVIRLCSIECCFAHDLESCPQNRAFVDDLEEWSSISPHLYIWDYVVNFSHYIMPYPNFAVLQPNIKTFINNKSIGIMEQAAYQSRGGEFAELRAYLLSKLLWNINVDADEVVDDFMFGYYGRSGQYVKEYFKLLQEQVKPDTHIHLGLAPDDKIFTNEFIEKADKILDKAEIVADNDELKQRVELARLPIMYLKCKRNPMRSKYDGTLQRFIKIIKREGISHFAEVGKAQKKAFFETIENAN